NKKPPSRLAHNHLPALRAAAHADVAQSLPPFADFDAGWRFAVVGDEEIRRQRYARVDPVALEVGDALGGEEGIIDQEIAGETRRLLEDAVCGIRQDVGAARAAHDFIAA